MRLLMAVFCLSIALAVLAQSPDGKDEKQQSKTQRDQRGTKKQPLFIEGIPAKKSEAETGEEREHRKKQISIGTDISGSMKTLVEHSEATVELTLLLFIATAVLAAITWYLALGAERTARRQLRAYVFVQSAGIKRVAIGGTPQATILVKNSGQTPAYDVRIAFGIAGVKNVQELEDLAKKNYGATRIVGPVHLSHGETLSPSCFFGGALNPAMWESLTAAKVKLYVHGRIDYTDIFGKKHWTTLRSTQGEKGTPVGSDRLAICQDGNDADRG